MRRRRNERRKWALVSLVPVALAAVIQVARLLLNRRAARGKRAFSPRPAGFEGAYARIQPGQVPVTAQRRGKRGTARAYDAPHTPEPSRQAPPPAVEERRRFPWVLALGLLLVLGGFTVFSLMGSDPARVQVPDVPGGDVEAGRQAIQSWGCGSCHTIPGVAGAHGKVGPRLGQMAEQTYIAGMLPNTPENLVLWIRFPQEIQPGNAMPNTDVPEATARNMAAYLYSIRDR